MSKISDYAENGLINLTFRNGVFASPGTNLYLALFTSDPLDDASGTEVNSGGYARVQASSWTAPSARSIQNSASIIFPIASADWGIVTHAAIFDALTTGNMLWSGSLASPNTINSGEIFTIDIGGIVVSIGGNISTYLGNAWINHLFRGIAFTSPGTSIHISLHTSTPGLAGADEISGNNYGRIQSTSWGAPSNGVTSNASVIAFATPSGNWGTINGYGIWDSSSSGNFLGGGVIMPSLSIISGLTGVNFPPTDFVIAVA